MGQSNDRHVTHLNFQSVTFNVKKGLHLPNVKSLKLSTCNNIEEICRWLAPNLEKFHILTNLDHRFSFQGSFTNLKELVIANAGQTGQD